MQYWTKFTHGGGIGDVSTSPSPCPISFSDEEIEECLGIEEQQEEADAEMDKIRNIIGISVDGWTSHEMYKHAREQARFIKENALSYAENEHERQMINTHWPFDDHDETE